MACLRSDILLSPTQAKPGRAPPLRAASCRLSLLPPYCKGSEECPRLEMLQGARTPGSARVQPELPTFPCPKDVRCWCNTHSFPSGLQFCALNLLPGDAPGAPHPSSFAATFPAKANFGLPSCICLQPVPGPNSSQSLGAGAGAQWVGALP